jgi:hypothetical protein
VTAAVIGLVGVVIGASVSGLVQWLMTRRSDRLAARTAARVVRYELRQYESLLKFQLANSHWEVGYWISPVRWREHQATLAAACASDEWSTIEMAYTGIEIVDSWHRQPPGSSSPPNVEPDPQKSGMPVVLSNVKAGVHALDRLAAIDGGD